jgi:hypothetical protein
MSTHNGYNTYRAIVHSVGSGVAHVSIPALAGLALIPVSLSTATFDPDVGANVMVAVNDSKSSFYLVGF